METPKDQIREIVNGINITHGEEDAYVMIWNAAINSAATAASEQWAERIVVDDINSLAI
jgi:hypothetical protein